LKDQTKKDIKLHAEEERPYEACGFVISTKDRGIEKVIRGENKSERPHENFLLSANSFIKASELGEIIAIYHSHVDQDERPSTHDVVACNRLEKTWIIYSLITDTFKFIYPEGKDVPLLGREFVFAVQDCFTLIKDYYKELGVIIPNYEYDPFYVRNFWDKGLNPYVELLEENGFSRVHFKDAKEKDLLLFCIGSRVPNHSGIYVGNNKMLHHMDRRLSCIDLLGNYWRDVMHGCYRHRSL
jgi:proteasome lid subunit RPN8/RPN11